MVAGRRGDTILNILIPIEISSRELLYKMYLARLLAARGFTCYLGRKAQINYLMRFLSGYVYIDKGYHKNQSEILYRIIKSRNGVIVSLDEEGGIDYSDNSTLLGRYSKNLFSYADVTFLWGSKQFDLVKSNLTESSEVIISGHPRFEMLKPEYHYLYKTQIHDIKKKYGKFILVNTNFGFGNNIKGEDFVRSNYGGRFKNILRIIDFDRRKLQAYIELVKELAGTEKLQIVFRPHPEECHKAYLREFSNLPNVSVVYSGSVVPWLIAAERIIHPDCTTAIEAMFLGRQACSFLPKDYPPELATQLPVSASVQCNSFHEVSEFLSSENTKVSEQSYNLVNSYFSIGLASFEIIVARLAKIKSHLGVNEPKIYWWHLFFLRLQALKSKLSRSPSQQLANRKLQEFNWETIQKINGKILERDHDKNKVKLTKLNRELFVFSSSEN